jgi:HK97 family phage portal protein
VLNRAPVSYTSGRLSFPVAHRNDAETQMRAMGSVGTLFAIVNRTSNGTAQVNWRLYRKAKSGKPEDRTEVTSHLALDIWNRPNPFMTRQEFVEAFQQHVDLTGEGWWIVGRDTRSPLPLELWPVRPDRMSPVPSATDFLSGYVYQGPDGEKVPLEPPDVIFLRMPNPLDPYRGMGPVQSILTDLDSERYSAEWNRNFFLNSAEPGGIIEVAKRLSDDEFKEMTTRWREQHQGVAQAHRVAVLEQGTWKDRKFSMRDMQFTELRSVSREIIREAFGFPKPMLGATDDVNRANAEAAEVVFARWLMVPRLERIKGALNNDFLPLFGGQGDLEFDYDDPTPADSERENSERDSKVTAAQLLIDAGFNPTEVLEAFDLPELTYGLPGADPDRDLLTKLVMGAPTLAPMILPMLGFELPEQAAPAPPAPGQEEPPSDAAVVDRVLAHLQGHAGHARHPRPPRRRPRAADDPPDLDPEDLPDISHMQDSWEQALDQLLEEWTGLEDDQKDELVDAVREIAESGDLADLAELDVGSDATAAALEAAMLALAAEAAEQVADEAAEQGVPVTPQEADEALIAQVALVVAAVRAAQLAAGAALAAMRANGPEATPDDVADAVREHLDSLSPDGPRPLLGGALTGAQNAGRIATLRAAPEGALYANEVLDTNTCGPCREVDGRWLGNISEIEQVLASYPGGAFGGYVSCRGRERCRGTITGVWRQ